MESMTGYGAGSAEGEQGRITVQIASVNNRGCRVNVRSEIRDLGLEEQVRGRVQEALRRGSITVQVAFAPAGQLGFDPTALRAAWRELATIAEELGAPVPQLADAARQLPARAGGPDVEGLQPLVEAACDEAIAACLAMRRTEGEALTAAFRDYHGQLFALKAEIVERAAGRSEAYATRLEERLGELLRDRAAISDEHLVRELAIYADRIDVSEELVRLDSHLEQIGDLLAAEGAIGKRMEFLLQELGREINTTGAKANDAGLQQLVVAAKGVVEQMKEQSANLL